MSPRCRSTTSRTCARATCSSRSSPPTTRPSLQLAEANLAAAQATLANLANQRDVQQALDPPGRGDDRGDRGRPAALHARGPAPARPAARPGSPARSRRSSRREANEKRTAAQLAAEQRPARPAEGAARRRSTCRRSSSQAQVQAAEAQVALAAQQSRLYAHRLAGRRAGRPAPGAARPVRQCRHAGDRRRAAAEHLGDRQLQGDADDQRAARPARRASPSMPFPDLELTGHVDSWSPGTGSTFALLPPDNATGNFTKVVQRVPVKIVLDRESGARHAGAARHVGRGDDRHRRGRRPTPATTPSRQVMAASQRPSRRVRTSAHPASGTRRPSPHPAAAAPIQLAALCRHPRRAARLDARDARQPGHDLRPRRSARRAACRVRRGRLDHDELRRRPDDGRRRLRPISARSSACAGCCCSASCSSSSPACSAPLVAQSARLPRDAVPRRASARAPSSRSPSASSSAACPRASSIYGLAVYAMNSELSQNVAASLEGWYIGQLVLALDRLAVLRWRCR